MAVCSQSLGSKRQLCSCKCQRERSVDISTFEDTGDIQPKAYQHGPCKHLGDSEQLLLLRLILQNPGIYLHEIQAELLAKLGVVFSCSTICRTLKYMGCTRQVLQHVALQRSDELRLQFMAQVSVYDPA